MKTRTAEGRSAGKGEFENAQHFPLPAGAAFLVANLLSQLSALWCRGTTAEGEHRTMSSSGFSLEDGAKAMKVLINDRGMPVFSLTPKGMLGQLNGTTT